MRKTFYFILLGVLFLFLQSCCNNEKRSKNIYNDLDLNNNKFLGEWYSVEREQPFGAVLTINSNYNFTYVGGACVLHFDAKGQWVLQNDTLILNSTDPEKCYYIINFDDDCVEIDPKDLTTSKSWGTSIEGCTPESPDAYVIFENEKFIIRDSVLMHIQKPNKLCPEIKNDFTRKMNTDDYR
jgi:hypothetical protein